MASFCRVARVAVIAVVRVEHWHPAQLRACQQFSRCPIIIQAVLCESPTTALGGWRYYYDKRLRYSERSVITAEARGSYTA